MLKQRIITALILLALILPAVFAVSPIYFALFALAAVTAAMWEWARLLRFESRGAIACALILCMVCAALWFTGMKPHLLQSLHIAAVAAWGGMLILSLPQARFPAFLLQGAGRALHVLFALLVLSAGWSVLVLAQRRGAFFALSMIALVAAADIAAYFAGKAYGKHKLAPNISPGKTREGAIGGLAGAVALALACYGWQATYFAALGHQSSLIVMVMLTLLLAAVSICGDLFESLLKRQAGAKDSSHLLPGHGGVLDRIDALIPVMPLAWLML